ncbi:MAG: hypothetical protein PVI30_26300 [Myxococcales bacterium]|jgi:hypothetical protein
METLVHAIYHDEQKAAAAVQALIEADFEPGTICVLMKKGEGADVEELPVEHKTGVGRGAAVGGVLGVLAGALVGPGLIAAGPLVAALEAVFAGGAVGSVTGALAGLGYWKDEADLPVAHIEGGAVLVGAMVPRGAQVDRAAEALRQAGGEELACGDKDEAADEVRKA